MHHPALRDGPRGLPLLVLLLAAQSACAPAYPPPPDTRTVNVVDTLHGVAIPDPYRWLEDRDDPATRAWIDEQNAYADLIVGDSPLRTHVTERLRALMDIDDVGSPRRAGDFEYFTMRRKGEDLPIIYRRPVPDEDAPKGPIDPAGEYEVVIDPHGMSAGHTTRVAIESFSPDGDIMLYSVRDGGQDEVEIRARSLDEGVDLPDRLPNALYSSVSFKPDGSGFYYSRRSRETGARIYFHRLGANIDDDEMMFGEGHGPDRFVSMTQADDGRYHIYTVQHGWARSEVYVRDLARGGRLDTIVADADARFYPRFIDGELFMRTNLDAPNNRIVAVDLRSPQRDQWREVLAEADDVLQNFAVIDDQLYATYMHNVSTKIRVFEMDGTAAGDVEVPELHSATIRGAGEGEARLSLTSFHRPSVTYTLDLESGERTVWEDRNIPFDGSDISVSQVWYESKDGTRVPMSVVHREDVTPNGERPTLLYGYGGFNSAQGPRFNAMAAVWLEMAGVYAVANLRGGSEFGERWHRAGMLENKQNVFDDFIAAAEWLIANDYTNPNRLAIRGGSNGGLLVASALTQRPELYRAVLCGFPDLDMVRFYQFTKNNNIPALLEYGNGAIPEQFEFLRAYSPYQHVEEGTDYPAVMLTSGDLDTRVSPLQARKMTARLQAATTSGLPVVLRYDPKQGHAAGRGRPFSRAVTDTAAELTFLLSQLGVELEAMEDR